MQISISNLFLAAFLIAISDDAIQIPPAFVAQTHTHTNIFSSRIPEKKKSQEI